MKFIRTALIVGGCFVALFDLDEAPAAGVGPFYGNLSKYDHLKPMKNDDLRRQLIVLNLVAIATGRLTAGSGAPVTTLNNALREKCFTDKEREPPTFELGGENGIGTYEDATAASTDANDGVLGDDGSGDPVVEDVFIADPYGETIPPDDGGGGDGGDDGHLLLQ